MIKKIIAVFALAFVAGYSNFAKSEDFYLFCDTCTSDSDFLTVADQQTPPTGFHNVLVFNVDASTVKAYTVEFLDSGGGKLGGQKIISTRSVPAEAYRALQLYDKLMEGVMVESSSSQSPLSSTFSNQLSSEGVANGCGSPEYITYYFIPDQPFLDACNNHDICYTTSQTKHTCDSNFLRDMLAKVDEIISRADVDGAMAEFLLNERLVKAIIGEALVKMAGLYHRAVVNTESALNAYCNNTTAYNPPECSGSESAEGTFTGIESTESVQRPGGGSVVAKCELWQFPDGNGGVYYMLRNCQYQTSV